MTKTLQARHVETGDRVLDFRFKHPHFRTVVDTALVSNDRGNQKVHLRVVADNGAEMPDMLFTPSESVTVEGDGDEQECTCGSQCGPRGWNGTFCNLDCPVC